MSLPASSKFLKNPIGPPDILQDLLPIQDLTSHLQQDLKTWIWKQYNTTKEDLEKKYNISNSQQTHLINKTPRPYPPSLNLSGTLLNLPANRVVQSGDGNWTYLLLTYFQHHTTTSDIINYYPSLVDQNTRSYDANALLLSNL